MLISWLLLQHCNAFGNHEELEKVKCLLKDKPGANKVNMGLWVWSEARPWPSWDAIAKAPICSSDEWEYFRIIVGKPVARPTMIGCAEDKERILAMGEGDGQQVCIAPIVSGKPVVQKLGALNYSMVCKTHPWYICDFVRLCITLCSIYCCRFCSPYWLLHWKGAHHLHLRDGMWLLNLLCGNS